MAKDIALMLRTMDRIEAHPEAWGQGAWRTCFASHALRESGHTIGIDDQVHKDGVVLGFIWEVAAQVVLGEPRYFNSVEARRLFFSENTLEDLRDIITGYINAEVESEIVAQYEPVMEPA